MCSHVTNFRQFLLTANDGEIHCQQLKHKGGTLKKLKQKGGYLLTPPILQEGFLQFTLIFFLELQTSIFNIYAFIQILMARVEIFFGDPRGV